MEVNNSSDGVQPKRELSAERKQNWLDVLLGSLGSRSFETSLGNTAILVGSQLYQTMLK